VVMLESWPGELAQHTQRVTGILLPSQEDGSATR